MQHQIKKTVNYLRERPEHHKRQILYGMIILAGILLFTLWTWSLGSVLSSQELQAKLQKDLEPFKELNESLTTSYQTANTAQLNLGE